MHNIVGLGQALLELVAVVVVVDGGEAVPQVRQLDLDEVGQLDVGVRKVRQARLVAGVQSGLRGCLLGVHLWNIICVELWKWGIGQESQGSGGSIVRVGG